MLVRYALQSLADLLGGQLVTVLPESGRLVEGDLLLLLPAVGADLDLDGSPEILAVPMLAASEDYLRWIDGQVD